MRQLAVFFIMQCGVVKCPILKKFKCWLQKILLDIQSSKISKRDQRNISYTNIFSEKLSFANSEVKIVSTNTKSQLETPRQLNGRSSDKRAAIPGIEIHTSFFL